MVQFRVPGTPFVYWVSAGAMKQHTDEVRDELCKLAKKQAEADAKAIVSVEPKLAKSNKDNVPATE